MSVGLSPTNGSGVVLGAATVGTAATAATVTATSTTLASTGINLFYYLTVGLAFFIVSLFFSGIFKRRKLLNK